MKASDEGNIADWGKDQQCRAKYRHFVERVFDEKGAWILVSPNGPLEIKIIDNQWALSLWTSEHAAVAFAKLKGLEHTFYAEFVPLDELTDEAIPDLINAGLQIHPNPQDTSVGLLIPPEEFRRNLYFIASLHERKPRRTEITRPQDD